MKDQKGQALVEFILILPILLLIFLGLFDIGNVFYQRYQLMNELDVVADLYQDKKFDEYTAYVQKKRLNIGIEKKDQLTTITLSKSLKITTPGLDQVLKNKIEVETTVYEK